MKETKVYIDELPNSCSKCEWCTLNHKDNYGRPFCLIARMPLYNGDKIKEERGQHKASLSDFDCPLQLIKDHDRELVKEVCEKIRTMAHKVGKLVFCEHCYKTNSARAIDEHLLNEILGQIESEFEQKEYEK